MREIIFFVFFIFFSNLNSSSSHSVVSNRDNLTISSKKTLVSPQNLFELGLFKAGTYPALWYLGIWCKKDPKRTNLWVANRDSPLLTAVGILRFSEERLLLLDLNGKIYWKTNALGQNCTAQLEDSGNFVVKDSEDVRVWESFDHPSDTLLPGMKLDKSMFLESWAAENDPGKGSVQFWIKDSEDRNELFVTYQFDPIEEIWEARDTWDGYRFGSMPPILKLEDPFNATFVMTRYANLSRLTLRSDGVYEVYTWIPKSLEWRLLWSVNDACYQRQIEWLCGLYSYCFIEKTSSASCNCFEGFTPKLDNESELTECVRKKDLNCSSDIFLVVKNMKLPEHVTYTSHLGFEACEKHCLESCHCNAFAQTEITKGQNRCFHWFSGLHNMQNYSKGGQNLYVRVAAKAHENDKKRSKGLESWIIGLIVALVVGGLFLIGFIIFYYWKKKRMIQGAGPTSHDITMNEIAGPVDRFQFMELRVVEEATDNFSDANMLGQGGFGAVYKGTLQDGTEVAVKRLAQSSSQGMREFKTEIQTILNVLHVNLVRLHGCCCEGDEIILVYEFLENGSLNKYIFDDHRSGLLNWAMRKQIINGVSQGLLYLHCYASPTILHRDMKPSNILLGQDMVPKISDFGLAKVLENDTRAAETNKPVGTRGYMAEEYAVDMIMSEKSDIFSFGVTILEIITGESNIRYCDSHRGDSLLDKAWRYWNDGQGLQLMDSKFADPSLDDDEEVIRSIQVGLLCVQANVEDRPSTRSVALMLESSHSVIPRPKPPNYFIARINRGEAPSSSSGQSTTVNFATFSRMEAR